MFAWFFISALYLQRVLGYRPMQVGLAFLPANLIMALFSLGLSARLVMRFGLRLPLGVGLLLAAAGLALFARAPVDGSFLIDVLPGMTLLGLGAGIAFNPVLLAAMSDVEPSESGLASGIVNVHDGRRGWPRRAGEPRCGSHRCAAVVARNGGRAQQRLSRCVFDRRYFCGGGGIVRCVIAAPGQTGRRSRSALRRAGCVSGLMGLPSKCARSIKCAFAPLAMLVSC
jgi:Major Facilitator Superfamily